MADQSTFNFGPGSAWGQLIQTTDGATVAVPQPRKFDVMQSLDIAFDVTVKRLMGNQIFPRAIGLADGKVTAKLKTGRFMADSFNLRFGQPGQPTTGTQQLADDEVHTVPASPFQFTVTPPGGGTFLTDWGVRYSGGASQGVPFTVVSSAPATGQYSVTAGGQYTFAAGDQGAAVVVSYEFTLTTGKTIQFINQIQGAFGLLKLRYQGIYGSGKVGVLLPNVVGSTFNTGSKEGDFTVPEMDFEAYADASGNVAFLYLVN